MGLITGAPSDLVQAVASRLSLGLIAELANDELQPIFAALSSVGVRFRQSKVHPTAVGHSLRFAFTGRLLLELVIVLAVAVASYFFGSPVASSLALPVALTMCWQAAARIPHALEIPQSLVDEKLGVLDRNVWAELAVARRGIRGAEARVAADRCLSALCAVIEEIRGGAWHLIRSDFSHLDQDAHALLRQTFRLAAAADRVALACDRPGLPASRLARLAIARREMFAALSAIEVKLEALRFTLVELSGLEARNDGLLAVTTRVTEIQVAVETGLDLSALAVEEPRHSLRA
ncbi:MAG TPA: hypothetical protein VNW92_28855 [Polyangiaceae bacterium]|nr:hypothetical protein [Polyangiaceae bacterium]